MDKSLQLSDDQKLSLEEQAREKLEKQGKFVPPKKPRDDQSLEEL